MKFTIPILLLLCSSVLCANQPQRIITVQGRYTYYVPENVSVEQAKRTAVERARLEALADAFGTEVSQYSTISVVSNNDDSETFFRSLGGTEVKGDWLSDIKDPEIIVDYQENQLIITAIVCGKARERKKAEFDLSVKLLCNGEEKDFFYNNDRFSIQFMSPVKGYLSVYLVDDNVGTAYCLVPYENGNGKAREIKNNKQYVLLSTKDSLYPYDEETILTTQKDIEYNRFVIVFSTNEFVMPIVEDGKYVPELSIENFDRWLHKNRMKDVDMQVMEKMIKIKKND